MPQVLVAQEQLSGQLQVLEVLEVQQLVLVLVLVRELVLGHNQVLQ
jgi:hypothetical protein